MSENNLIFTFDLVRFPQYFGVCVRKERKILYLDSLIINLEFVLLKGASKRLKQIRTRIVHKKKEKSAG
jgi:hypothetical protein